MAMVQAIEDLAGDELQDTDAQLMWRLRSRDEDALGELYDRHAALAFGLALRMVRDRAAAEEVVQDTFLTLWRQAANYRPDRASCRSWICTIVRSRAIDRLRRSASKEARDGQLAEDLAGLCDTWQLADESLRAQAVHQAVEGLPREQRQVLELAYFLGLSQAEISERTGAPLGTVKGRTRLALQHLRSALASATQLEEVEP
ncbi:MAG: sigma-70 family RNA polymerase sigma factor [Candidatus Dormibacteria bacterium]